jgi:hypothetical protein
MRKMPQLQNGAKQKKMTTTFMGYNHHEIIEDGEMYDMKNLSGDLYPLMAQRRKRVTASFAHGNVDDPLTGINGRDQLTFILGTDVYYNFTKVTGLTVSDDPSMCPKKIVNFGAYVCIWPDKKYFNTIQLTDCGNIDRLFSASGQNVGISLCRADGTDYDMTQITVSATEPSDPTNGKLWIDQSGDEDILRQYSSAYGDWIEVATTFLKISASGIGTGLNIYDAVTISGMEAQSTASDKVKAQVSDLNASKIVYAGGVNYIVVVGLLSATITALKSGTTVRVDRKVPDMDWIVESNNRLWGCRYGWVNGQVVNEIRASALGDFRNWERFLGNSQDSYTANVGTDGAFTGAVVQKSYPVFFKENCIHQVNGQMPSNFSISTTMCRGVQRGSGRSVVVVNETAYYKSRTDIMMFDGSMPVSVSAQLGDILYSDARAGAVGSKYYISMKDANENWTLFTYDTEKGVWYKEDDFHALGFGRVGDELYAVNEDNNTLVGMTGNVGEADPSNPMWDWEDDFDWEAVFGIQGAEYGRGQYGSKVRADTDGSRYMSRFDIRMWLGDNSKARLWIQYNDGEWQDKGEIPNNHRMRSFVLPVVPIRCDHLRFKLTGTGSFRVYSISRILEVGSDGGIY